MRTDWSVFALCGLLLAGGCQSSPRGSESGSVWVPVAEAREASAPDTGEPEQEALEKARKRPLELSVAAAVDESLEANPGVRTARLQEAIARTVERESRAGLLPAFFFRGTYSRRDSPPNAVIPPLGATNVGPQDQANANVTLEFPIFAFGRYINAYKAAQLSRQAAEADTHASEADVAAAVTAAAFDLLLTQESVRVAQANEDALLRQVQDSQALLDAGRVTRSALLEAQVLHDIARREKERAASLVKIKRMTLNELLGRPPHMETAIIDDRDVPAPEFDLGKLTSEALRRRPELIAARLDVESAVRNAKSVLGRWLPEVRGAVRYQATDNAFTSPQSWATFDLSLDIPLYVGGANYAQIRRARREVEVQRVLLENLERRVQTEVATAYREVMESYKDIGVGVRSIKRSEENLRIQREKFNNGRAISQEVLQSNSLLTNSRFDWARAVYSYKNALRELHRARGADPRVEPKSTDTPQAAGKGAPDQKTPADPKDAADPKDPTEKN